MNTYNLATIKELKDLLETGVITEEEFHKMKSEILFLAFGMGWSGWWWQGQGNRSWLIPEIIAFMLLGLGSIGGAENLNGFELGARVAMAAFIWRCSWNITLLLHGLGHSLLGAMVDQDLSFLRLSNILEHRSLTSFMSSCLPFRPIFIPTFSEEAPLWLEVGKREPWRVRIKGLGGPLMNGIVGLLCGGYWLTGFLHSSGEPSWAAFFLSQSVIAFAGLNFLLLLSSRTDWLTVISGQAQRLYCGNFGFVGLCHHSPQKLLPAPVVSLFRVMGQETEIRGAQAGGALTLALHPSGQTVFVGHKKVNSKRGNLTQSLEKSFERVRKKAVREGIQPLKEVALAAWHYRFGTSGPPSIEETHWHEWCAAQRETIWQIEAGQWIQTTPNINHRITHNGDFDGWQWFDQSIEHKTLGLWLERVLQTPNRTVGDSPKIAGMMDLLITQGNWLASVRLAYQLALAKGIEDAFDGHPPRETAPNTAPSTAVLNYWADILETVFFSYIATLPDAESLFNNEKTHQLQQQILQRLQTISPFRHYQSQQLINFVAVAVQAFLHNNVYRATQQFMAGAKGSFGLAVISTLMPERIVLSALGQPMTIGVNPLQKYSIYGSESSAVDAALRDCPGSYRLDLNQNSGEIAVLGATSLVIYSMTHRGELPEAEIHQRQVVLNPHPYIQVPIPSRGNDPIEEDLQEIPRVLSKIEGNWLDPTSLNRQTAEYFLSFLITKARYLQDKQEKLTQMGLDPSLAESRHVDILITGVENSLWLGEQFAKDLKTIFPLLSIKTRSSNQVLHQLQSDFADLHLARQSLVLAITQSGQTFPTRQVLYACDLLVRQKVIREFFVLTGEPNSFIGSSLAQPTYPGEPFSRRIFISNSGRRTAEPATIAVAACHHTLTQLLFYLADQMQLAFPQEKPLGMTLSLEGLLILEQTKKEVLQQNIPELMGATTTGQRQKTRLHRQIIERGRRWAWPVLETPMAWAIQALYVLITVGWLIPFGYMIPLVQTSFQGLFWALQVPADAAIVSFWRPGLILADMAIYIWGTWFWTLGLRLLQRRSLLARTGKRTLVIGDVPWVHQLLKTYVSKLFALSYGISSLEIHGANPQDHLLHQFAHRLVRGTLLFLGIPDGRGGQRQKNEENAVLMTAKQASGIQHLGTGPEIVAMGSNPAIAHQGFTATMVLPHLTHDADEQSSEASALTDKIVESLQESRFGAFQRLLASYVFFWALAKRVATFPLLHYAFWKSQSRTKVMTTAAPVSATHLNRPEPEESSMLELGSVANREQS